MPELRMNRRFPHIVKNPVDEAASEQEGHNAAGHRGDGNQRALGVAPQIA